MQVQAPVSDQLVTSIAAATEPQTSVVAKKSDVSYLQRATSFLFSRKKADLSSIAPLSRDIVSSADQIKEIVKTMPKIATDIPPVPAMVIPQLIVAKSDLVSEKALLSILTPIAPSISSRGMSAVMNVRNSTIGSVWSKALHVAKVAVAETILPFITVAATIETIVYRSLLQSAAAFSRWTPSLKNWCEKHAIIEKHQSASFTISWSFFTLYHNLSFAPLAVAETDAREFFASRKPKQVANA